MKSFISLLAVVVGSSFLVSPVNHILAANMNCDEVGLPHIEACLTKNSPLSLSPLDVSQTLKTLLQSLQQGNSANVDKILLQLKHQEAKLSGHEAPIFAQLDAVLVKVSLEKPARADWLKEILLISNSWIKNDQRPEAWNQNWFNQATRLAPAFAQNGIFLERVRRLPLEKVSKDNPEVALWITKVACFSLRLQNKIQECDRYLDILSKSYNSDSILCQLVALEKAKNLRDAGNLKKASDLFENAHKKLLKLADPGLIQWIELYVAEMTLSTGNLVKAEEALGKHEVKMRLQTSSFPWERLYGKTLRLQLLRKKNNFQEAVSYGEEVKREYGSLMVGNLQAWIWFDLERLYIYALIGDKENTSDIAKNLLLQLEKLPSLSFLKEIPAAFASLSSSFKVPPLLTLKKSLGAKHHVYVEAQNFVTSLERLRK